MIKYFKIAAVLLIVVAGYAYYMYSKPMSDTSDIDADYSMSADSLFYYFDENESDANVKYLGKVIEIKGVVREMTLGEKGEINLMMDTESEFFGISCEISKSDSEEYNTYKVGDKIKLKGECTGILSDVVMTRCVIVK